MISSSSPRPAALDVFLNTLDPVNESLNRSSGPVSERIIDHEFLESALRRSDVLQSCTASLLTTCRLPRQRVEVCLFLARQFFPPEWRTVRGVCWSVLRFLLLGESGSPSFAFDVRTTGIDVSAKGAFTAISSNCVGSIVAAYSFGHCGCVIFAVPQGTKTPNTFIISKTITWPSSQGLSQVRWHGQCPNILGLLSTDDRVHIFDISKDCHVPCIIIDLPSDSVDFRFISPPSRVDGCFHVLALTATGRIIAVCGSPVQMIERGDDSAHRGCSNIRAVEFLQRIGYDRQLPTEEDTVVATSSVVVTKASSVELIRRGLSQKDSIASSLVILADGPFLVVARIDCTGCLEVFGVDLNVEELVQQMDDDRDFYHAYPEEYLLDTVTMNVIRGCSPTVDVNGSGTNFPTPDSLLCTITTPNVSELFTFSICDQIVYVVEFPWMSQITSLAPTSPLLPPRLVPSICYVVWSCPSSDDILVLGTALSPGTRHNKVVLIKGTFFVAATDGSNPELLNPGWDIARDICVEMIDLEGKLAARRDITRYHDALNVLWGLDSNSTEAGEAVVSQRGVTLSIRDQLRKAATAYKQLAIPQLLISQACLKVNSKRITDEKRYFTFNVMKDSTAHDLLDCLEVSYQKVSRLKHFRDQLCMVQKAMNALRPEKVVVDVEAKLNAIRKQNERIRQRIEDAKDRNVNLLESFAKVFSALSSRAVDTHLTVINESVLKIIRIAITKVPSLLSTPFSFNQASIIDKLTEELLLESSVANSCRLSPPTSGEVQLLKIKELTEAFRQHSEISQEIEDSLRRKDISSTSPQIATV